MLGAAPPVDELATALIHQMLEANKPWLRPSPIKGNYSLLRWEPGSTTAQHIGGAALDGNAPLVPNEPARQTVDRVGSLIWTPLHNLAYGDGPSKAHVQPGTNSSGSPELILSLEFNPTVRDQIGFGGQEIGDYSEASYTVQTATIFLNPTNALPTLIRTQSATWTFDSGFFAVENGFAPRAVDWDGDGPNMFSERQEFQLFQGEWLFKKGQAWWTANRSGLIQTFELVDLQIEFPNLLVKRAGAELSLAWQPCGRSGVILEASDALNGPWSALLEQVSYDVDTVAIAIQPSKPQQFYRLSKPTSAK